MADMNMEDFHTRINRIEKSHNSLSSGYVRLVERNGMLVPVKKVRTRRGFPWRGIFMVAVVFLVFKAFMLAQLGSVNYVERHAQLEAGNYVEQLGAWALRPDPLTVLLSEQLAPVVKFVNAVGIDS